MRYRAWRDLSTESGEPILARVPGRRHPAARGWARAAFGAAVLAAALASGGCAVNPVTGKQELSLVSTAEEIETGEQHFLPLQQIMGGLYKADPAVAEYVAEIGRRLASVSDRALPYEFVVFNASEPNALALPGGKIGITRGLLLEMEDEAELAAILGHEIVHAAARHGAQAQQRRTLGALAMIGVAIAAGGSGYADLIAEGSDMGLQLLDRKYTRDDEREADFFSMKYLHAAGYDTAAAVSLQEKFVALDKGDRRSWWEGLLATHPPSTERVQNNRAALKKFPPGGTRGRAAYEKGLAHLLARRQAYEDADRASQIFQEDPRAALRLIRGAIAREPNEAMFHGIRGWILASEGRPRDALRAFDAAIRRDGQYYAHYLGRGVAHASLGNRRRAWDDLVRSYNILPTAHATYEMGRIAHSQGEREHAKSLFKAAARAGGRSGELAREEYVRLDVVEAPERYLAVQPIGGYGRVLVRVTNSSGIALRDIEVRVVDLSGSYPRDIGGGRVDRLPAGTYRDVGTGVYWSSWEPEEIGARVVRASPAD